MIEGKLLRLYLRANDIPVNTVIKKLNVTRQTVNNWFGKENLDDYIYEKLKKINVKKTDIIKPDKIEEEDSLRREYEFLKKENALLREMIDILKKK